MCDCVYVLWEISDVPSRDDTMLAVFTDEALAQEAKDLMNENGTLSFVSRVETITSLEQQV